MSPDWTTNRCDPPLPKNHEERHGRDMLVWSSVAIDLGEITKKNVDEWVWRLWFQRKTTEAIHIPEETTPAEVRKVVERWVGLGTNVTTLTRKQWLKKVTEIMVKRITWEVSEALPDIQ
jgi:hypothetical protein